MHLTCPEDQKTMTRDTIPAICSALADYHEGGKYFLFNGKKKLVDHCSLDE